MRRQAKRCASGPVRRWRSVAPPSPRPLRSSRRLMVDCTHGARAGRSLRCHRRRRVDARSAWGGGWRCRPPACRPRTAAHPPRAAPSAPRPRIAIHSVTSPCPPSCGFLLGTDPGCREDSRLQADHVRPDHRLGRRGTDVAGMAFPSVIGGRTHSCWPPDQWSGKGPGRLPDGVSRLLKVGWRSGRRSDEALAFQQRIDPSGLEDSHQRRRHGHTVQRGPAANVQDARVGE